MKHPRTIQTASDYVATAVEILRRKIEDANQPSWYPNFFLTDEYVAAAQLEVRQCGNWVGVVDPEYSEEWFFPPIYVDAVGGEEIPDLRCASPYSIGFPGMVWGSGVWDRQYIYHPRNFERLEGYEWSSFRRNIRKWPKRHGQQRDYRPMDNSEVGAAADLAQRWSNGKTIQDVNVFLTYILRGKNRWGLFRSGQLVGMNVWDENDIFINYRICIDNGEPFLQEYLRHQFYTNNTKDSVAQGKIVNDGGDLDDEGLAMFKKKLNPITIQEVPTKERQLK